MSGLALDPPNELKAGPLRGRRRRALLVLVLLLASVVAGSWWRLSSLPPREIAVLASGGLTFEVPILTYYTLPAAGVGSSVETTFSYSGTEPFMFHWSGSASDGSPVHFVFRPRLNSLFSFEPSDDGGFVFRENGRTGGGSGVPSDALVVTYTWEFDYTVRRMAAYDGFLAKQWVEIDYTPPLSLISCGCRLPYANVSVPGAADLLRTGVVDRVNYASGNWSYGRSLSDFALPVTPFHHHVATVSIDLGTAGSVSASLESSFRWGPGGEDHATMSGRGNVDMTIAWYWDARFGGLYPVLTPPY